MKTKNSLLLGALLGCLGTAPVLAPGLTIAASPTEALVAAVTSKTSGPSKKTGLSKNSGAIVGHDVEFLGITSFAGDAPDGSGLSGTLEDQSPVNRIGGFSAMEYTGDGDRFVLLSDRGASDGAVSYPCRMHLMNLRLNEADGAIDAEFASTVMLTASDATTLNGSSKTATIDRSQSADEIWHAMDPEGIRRWKDGYLISDEYGPHIGVFSANGRLNDEWKLPASRRYVHLPEDLQTGGPFRGCFDNKGLEGLAVTPSSGTVWASYQSSLLQDGEFVDSKCRGDFVRWIAFDPQGRRVREVAYPLDHRKSGISELLAVDENQLLVLERDSKGGEKAKTKRIFLANVSDASDVAAVESLPIDRTGLTGKFDPVQPVKKRLLIDLLQWQDELGAAATAEKPEGLTWGRPLADGRKTLWICWDNDFEPTRRSYVACFAVDLSTGSTGSGNR